MSDAERTIRVALVGYGYAGKTFHAPLIGSVPGLRLTVVGSSRPDAVHADLADVIVCDAQEAATHADVDLVVIATPNESHHPLAKAALEGGKDVVVDKPFTLNLAEARSLREIAERHGRLLSVFHNRRWESEAHATRAVLASGALGEVVHYECHMDRYRPEVRKRWREDPGPGAGLWFDLGPHLIDLALSFFGLPESVTASFATLRPGGLTEDWAHVVLSYAGMRVVLHSSLLAAGGGPRTTLHGTKASWVKYGADTQEAQLKAGMRPDDAAFGIDPDAGVLIDGATGVRTEIAAARGDGRMYYVGILDAMLKRRAPLISARDAVAVMAVLEGSFESGRVGETVGLGLTAGELGEWG